MADLDERSSDGEEECEEEPNETARFYAQYLSGEKRHPGPRRKSYWCKGLYYLPPTEQLPSLKADRDKACIQEHMSQGYGFPSSLYKDGKPKALSLSLKLTTGQFRAKIRQLFPRLTGPFHIMINQTVRRMVKLEPRNCTPRYLKSLGAKGYQGFLIIKDDQIQISDQRAAVRSDGPMVDAEENDENESCDQDTSGLMERGESDTEELVTHQPSSQVGRMRCVAVRFKPGQELRQSLLDLVKAHGLKAAFVVTCVGSLRKATLRLADSVTIQTFQGPFEIVSLVGTLSGGSGHLHISLSNTKGPVIGGHVVSDLIIHTTAEVVIGECEGAQFDREKDEETGYSELVVYPRKS